TACPAAPFTKLSIALTTIRCRCASSAAHPMSQKFVLSTPCTDGHSPAGSSRTNGSPAYAALYVSPTRAPVQPGARSTCIVDTIPRLYGPRCGVNTTGVPHAWSISGLCRCFMTLYGCTDTSQKCVRGEGVLPAPDTPLIESTIGRRPFSTAPARTSGA